MQCLRKNAVFLMTAISILGSCTAGYAGGGSAFVAASAAVGAYRLLYGQRPGTQLHDLTNSDLAGEQGRLTLTQLIYPNIKKVQLQYLNPEDALHEAIAEAKREVNRYEGFSKSSLAVGDVYLSLSHNEQARKTKAKIEDMKAGKVDFTKTPVIKEFEAPLGFTLGQQNISEIHNFLKRPNTYPISLKVVPTLSMGRKAAVGALVITGLIAADAFISDRQATKGPSISYSPENSRSKSSPDTKMAK